MEGDAMCCVYNILHYIVANLNLQIIIQTKDFKSSAIRMKEYVYWGEMIGNGNETMNMLKLPLFLYFCFKPFFETYTFALFLFLNHTESSCSNQQYINILVSLPVEKTFLCSFRIPGRPLSLLSLDPWLQDSRESRHLEFLRNHSCLWKASTGKSSVMWFCLTELISTLETCKTTATEIGLQLEQASCHAVFAFCW